MPSLALVQLINLKEIQNNGPQKRHGQENSSSKSSSRNKWTF